MDMTQPKFMQEVLKEYPKIERYVSKKHPYGPPPIAGYGSIATFQTAEVFETSRPITVL